MTQKSSLPQRGRQEPAARARPDARTGWALGLLLAACVLAYANAWRGQFVSDDVVLRENIQQLSQRGGWAGLFRHDLFEFESSARSGFYRPLATLSLLVDQALFGSSPIGYHATNLFLHVVATWLVLGIGLHFGLPFLAVLGAATLFAVHPAHGEAVAWISGRFDVLCAALYLLSLWLFTLAHPRRSWKLVALALVAAAAALLSKEMALTLPAAVLLADLLGLTHGRRPRRSATRGFWADDWRGALWRALPFAAVVAAYVVLRVSSPGLALGRPGEDTVPLDERLWTSGRALFFYLGLLVWPGSPDAFPVLSPVRSPLDPWFLGALALAAVLAVLALRLRRAWPEITYGIAFVFLSMAPLSNLVALYPAEGFRFPVGERYMYLPSFGFVLVLGTLLWEGARRLRGRQPLAFAAALLVLSGAGVARSLQRNPAWSTNEALFSANLRANPRSAFAHVMMGNVHRGLGRFAEAIRSYESALQCDPRSYPALLEMGDTESRQEHWEAAAQYYTRALASKPRARLPRLGLARALRGVGRLDAAVREYAVLVARDPRDSESLVNQGELLDALGQTEAARRSFEQALSANPNRAEAHYNLARYALKRGALDEAERGGHAALACDPNYKEGYLLLGNVRVQRHDFGGAVRNYEKALEIDSTYVQARVNMGATYLNAGDYERAIEHLRRALRREPSTYAWVNLAEAQRRSKAPDAAERSCREALRLDPAFVPAHRTLGLALAGRPGREAEARQLLEGLPRGDDHDLEVEDALLRMRAKR